MIKGIEVENERGARSGMRAVQGGLVVVVGRLEKGERHGNVVWHVGVCDCGKVPKR